MGDVDEGDADPLLDGAQFIAHVLAKLEVEGRERFIEQQDLGFDGEGAGDGHTLLLATGKFAHQFVALTGECDEVQQLSGLLPPCGPVDAAHPQAISDVVGNGHKGEERQVLEDQRRRPLVGADPRHVLAANLHLAGRWFEKP